MARDGGRRVRGLGEARKQKEESSGGREKKRLNMFIDRLSKDYKLIRD